VKDNEYKTSTDDNTNPEHQLHQPSRDWRDICKGVSHDLFAHSWGQNILVSVALLFVAPAVGLFLMKDVRGILVGFGIGVTILFWIVWITVIRQFGPKTAQGEQRNVPAQVKPRFTVKAHSYTFSLGDETGGWTFTPEELKTPRVIPIGVSGIHPITVYVEGDELFVDAVLFRDAKRTIAMKHNELSEQLDGWDWNRNWQQLQKEICA
jgi:hypothetical protein